MPLFPINRGLMLTDDYLDEIERRIREASPGPWVSYVEGRDHTGGSNFIMTGPPGHRGEDIELSGATVADQDFMARARSDVPRLLAEVRRLKKLLPQGNSFDGRAAASEDDG